MLQEELEKRLEDIETKLEELENFYLENRLKIMDISEKLEKLTSKKNEFSRSVPMIPKSQATIKKEEKPPFMPPEIKPIKIEENKKEEKSPEENFPPPVKNVPVNVEPSKESHGEEDIKERIKKIREMIQKL